ncbi:MAG TPA: hypothetical protein VF070_39110 [Streptosporangiaceae bacterium]
MRTGGTIVVRAKIVVEQWLGARRYLNEHRYELTLAARALYPHDLRVAGTPLLARPEWLPDEPVALDQVALTLREEAGDGVPESSNAGPATLSYAEVMAELNRPALFENRVCYRLLDVTGKHLMFGVGRYFDLINTCEAVAHEFVAATLRGEHGSLALREQIGDPTDLTRRRALAAITTLVLTRGDHTHGDGGPRMILHWRDPAKVATGGGLYTTAPVGMFQPSHDAVWNLRNDFSLWRSLVRELNEELLHATEDYGSDEAPIDYQRWPLYRELTEAARTVRWLGLGVDPLSLVIDLLVVAVFDRPLGGEGINDEGRLVSVGFTEQNIERLITTEHVQPASAALLRLAWQHRDTLLR